MAEVVLFHHVQGLTDGVRAFAAELRAGGHTVHTPDLFEGKLPGSIDEGIALVDSIGDEVLTERIVFETWRPAANPKTGDGDDEAEVTASGMFARFCVFWPKP